jgi:hypothetical protein
MKMSCPYLTQVTMVFCRASPVKKMVPSDRLTTASTCEGESFTGCPCYRDALELARSSVESERVPLSTKREARKGAKS